MKKLSPLIKLGLLALFVSCASQNISQAENKDKSTIEDSEWKTYGVIYLSGNKMFTVSAPKKLMSWLERICTKSYEKDGIFWCQYDNDNELDFAAKWESGEKIRKLRVYFGITGRSYKSESEYIKLMKKDSLIFSGENRTYGNLSTRNQSKSHAGMRDFTDEIKIESKNWGGFIYLSDKEYPKTDENKATYTEYKDSKILQRIVKSIKFY